MEAKSEQETITNNILEIQNNAHRSVIPDRRFSPLFILCVSKAFNA